MINRISLSEAATHTVLRAAIQGYEAPYKEERLGILLGRVAQGNAQVRQAILYRGGTRTRSAATIDSLRFKKRVEELQRNLRLNFLGSFHTHNEIAGTISSAMSAADKEPLCEDLPPHIEIIATIWAGDGRTQTTRRYLQISHNGYRVRVAGYACQQRFAGVPVYSALAED
jgi:hypothetical protein